RAPARARAAPGSARDAAPHGSRPRGARALETHLLRRALPDRVLLEVRDAALPRAGPRVPRGLPREELVPAPRRGRRAALLRTAPPTAAARRARGDRVPARERFALRRLDRVGGRRLHGGAAAPARGAARLPRDRGVARPRARAGARRRARRG